MSDVPEGWRDGILGDLVRLQRGHDLPAQARQAGEIEVIGGGGPNGFHNVAKAQAPGIVIGRSGSGIGNAWWSEKPFWPLNTGLYVTDFLGNDPSFCFLWLDWIDFQSHNSGGAQPSLNRNFIYPIPLPIPPVSEQRKIAEILGTWDRAIEVSEALLVNARAQKRALMQSLFTGKRRFPEFEGQGWKEVRLGDVAVIIVSNVDKKTDPSEEAVRLCNYTDVYKREFIDPSQVFMHATASTAQIRRFRLEASDVVITKDSETASDIAMPTFVRESADDLICGYHLAIIRSGSLLNGHFLKYWFELPETRYYFGSRANGAIRFGLTIDGITGAIMGLPPLAEQLKIAKVIYGVETQIEVLAGKTQKLRTEKRALMQKLLTGKKRVKVNA